MLSKSVNSFGLHRRQTDRQIPKTTFLRLLKMANRRYNRLSDRSRDFLNITDKVNSYSRNIILILHAKSTNITASRSIVVDIFLAFRLINCANFCTALHKISLNIIEGGSYRKIEIQILYTFLEI